MCYGVNNTRACGHAWYHIEECSEARRTYRLCAELKKINNQWGSRCSACQRKEVGYSTSRKEDDYKMYEDSEKEEETGQEEEFEKKGESSKKENDNEKTA